MISIKITSRSHKNHLKHPKTPFFPAKIRQISPGPRPRSGPLRPLETQWLHGAAPCRAGGAAGTGALRQRGGKGAGAAGDQGVPWRRYGESQRLCPNFWWVGEVWKMFYLFEIDWE